VLTFGLGPDGKADSIVVTWPSGRKSEVTAPRSRTILTVEETP
jgi:hypothetical protein